MIGRTFAAAALLVCAALLPARAQEDHEARWRVWRVQVEYNYTEVRLAILKVNDAVFLEPGQTAWLLGTPEDPSSYRWSLEPDAGATLHIEFRPAGSGCEKAAPVRRDRGRGEGTFEAVLSRGDECIQILAQAKGGKGYAPVFGERGFLPVTEGIDLTGALTGEGTDDPRLQLKVYNQAHPAVKAFKGLEWFDYAPGLRIEAVYERATEPEAVIVETKRGLKKRFYRHGTARFTLDGKTVRMPLYAPEKDIKAVQEFLTLFTDETTGKETYGVGRYMDVRLPEAARVLIDFNRAYNPLCARSEHFNCPLVDLHIPVAIRAGEKAPSK